MKFNTEGPVGKRLMARRSRIAQTEYKLRGTIDAESAEEVDSVFEELLRETKRAKESWDQKMVQKNTNLRKANQDLKARLQPFIDSGATTQPIWIGEPKDEQQ